MAPKVQCESCCQRHQCQDQQELLRLIFFGYFGSRAVLVECADYQPQHYHGVEGCFA